ncbi:hypothetical protein [Actinophytocola sp.]|uniref:hypothetical protein n=1 Tax=Actinophytocola sp. TaxID=1872138 RepID=UPI003D6B710C
MMARWDQEKTARTLVASSPVSRTSNSPWERRSSSASVASGRAGFMAARAATIANGNRAHDSMIAATA